MSLPLERQKKLIRTKIFQYIHVHGTLGLDRALLSQFELLVLDYFHFMPVYTVVLLYCTLIYCI